MTQNSPRGCELMSVEFDTGSVEEQEIAHLFGAIEDENVPEWLVVLAIRLQDALVEQHARRNPN
jgi:hypothetical protein